MIRWASASSGTNVIASTATTTTSLLTILIPWSSSWETARPLRRAARPPPLGRLTSDTSGEPTGGDDATTIDRPERQHGQASRGRPVDDARAIGRIESRRVARAEERLGVPVPHRDGAAFVRADGGVRDDASGRLRPGVRAELRGIEPDQGHLIQQGSVANDLRHRIHREGELLRTAERQILGGDHLPGALTVGEDESVALAWPHALVVLSGEDVDAPERHTEPEAGGQLQRGTSVQMCCVSTAGWKNSPHLPLYARSKGAGSHPRTSRSLHAGQTFS